jgi:hypothetical protein
MATLTARECDYGARSQGRASLQSPFGIISVELCTEQPSNSGAILGAEGLGCEFFLDSEDRLTAMDLELRPREIVTVPPLDEIRSAREIIRAAAEPARVALEGEGKQAINPEVIWLSPAIDVAIFAFGAVQSGRLADLFELNPGLRFVQISSIAALALNPRDGNIPLILVESFGNEQVLFDTAVSAQSSGKDFMDALKSIHRRFFTTRDPQQFEVMKQQVIGHLRDNAPSEGVRRLEKLCEFYKRDLQVPASNGF